MPETLCDAHTQWASRPDDERFTSLQDLYTHLVAQRAASRALIVSSRSIEAVPLDNGQHLTIRANDERFGDAHAPTHWSFGQLASLAGAPAGYLRSLPAPMAADCINYGLQVSREVEDVGLLAQNHGTAVLRAATGPGYGRIWSSDIVGQMMQTLDLAAWKVPGVFGQALSEVTKENTTLYAGDRDMWVFLADETHRVDVPNRRNGATGQLYRGFFCWNSETGAGRLGLKTFYYDGVCGNRYVWGAEGVEEFSIIHRASAPDQYIEQMAPALTRYANASSQGITRAIEDARSDRLGDKTAEFLAKRFGPRMGAKIELAHVTDEGRPIETRWDALVGATAFARSIPHQDARIDFETEAAKLLA